MGTFTVETFIARPPEEVFAYLRDIANEAKWQSEHVSEVIVEPPGPARVGTLFHKARRTPFGEIRFTVKIMEMDETARRWADITMTGVTRGTMGSWQILSAEGGSTVRLTVEMRANGLWRLLLPLITPGAEKDLRAEFANLKKMLESAPQT